MRNITGRVLPHTDALQTNRSVARVRRVRCRALSRGGVGRNRRCRSFPSILALGVMAPGVGISRRAAVLRDQRPLYSPPHCERAGGGSIGSAGLAAVLPAALLAALSRLLRGPGVGRRSFARDPGRITGGLARGVGSGVPGPYVLPYDPRWL